MRKGLEIKADRGTFLTLDDVASFVQQAMRDGASGSTVLGARVSFGSKLQALTITIDTDMTKE